MRRWIRWGVAALWLVGGGLWVLLTLMLWLSNPVDDVDRGPSMRLFIASLLVWLAMGAGVVAVHRRLKA